MVPAVGARGPGANQGEMHGRQRLLDGWKTRVEQPGAARPGVVSVPAAGGRTPCRQPPGHVAWSRTASTASDQFQPRMLETTKVGEVRRCEARPVVQRGGRDQAIGE